MLLTESERTRLGTIDPAYSQAVEKDPKPEFDAENLLGIRAQRAQWLAGRRHLYPIPGPIPESVTETDHRIRARDGYDIPVIIYKPIRPPADGSPLVVMYHEGGFVMGDLTDEVLNCRMFARDLGAVCVNVDYRLGPEHKFPTYINDCWDVLTWCVKTAGEDILPTDLERGFIVGGASAGGNIAAVMAQLGRDRGLSPPLTGQYLCCPVVVQEPVLPEKWIDDFRSRKEAQSDPVIKFSGSDTLGALLAAIEPDNNSPLFNPLIHENLGNLAPAYFQLGGLDPLRDEVLIYEHELKENGVETRSDVYAGYGHMFWTNWPQMARSGQFVRDTLEGFRWLLNTSKK